MENKNLDTDNDKYKLEEQKNHPKMIRIDTIGGYTNRHYEIKGTPLPPKYIISPWIEQFIQSSIQPDENLAPPS